MASTYSTSLKLELIGNGDQSGTWGTTTNTNLGTLLEQAITGVQAITMVNANYTLSSLNGTSDEARNAVLVIGGTNSAIRSIIAPAVEKSYVIKNATSGGYAIVIKTSSSTGVTIDNGTTATVYCDGSEFYLSVPAYATTNTAGTLVYRDGSGNFSAGAITATSFNTSGNLAFTGTANRITGDFTNATTDSRAAFQTSTTNGGTFVGAIPNGTSTLSSFTVFNNSATTNSSWGALNQTGTKTQVIAGQNGTGTYGNLEFWTGGIVRGEFGSNGDFATYGSTLLAFEIGSGAAAIELGESRTADGTAYIDFHSSVGSDFDFRILRAAGANNSVNFYNAGTGGMYFYTNGVQRAAIDSAGITGNLVGNVTGNAATATKLSTATGSPASYSARAFVNFDGTGTVAIRESANVSSITDNGTGTYVINLTTAMPTTTYTCVGNCGSVSGRNQAALMVNQCNGTVIASTTTTQPIFTADDQGSFQDSLYVQAIIIG